MIIFKGNKRVFDKPFIEKNTSTSSRRNIEIYGVTSYDELTNVVLPIKATTLGEQNATLSVNDLEAKPIYAYKEDVLNPVEFNWVKSSQLYYVMYNGTYFVLYSSGSSSGGGEIVENNTYFWDGKGSTESPESLSMWNNVLQEVLTTNTPKLVFITTLENTIDLVGDINKDGSITIKDLNKIVYFIQNPESSMLSAIEQIKGDTNKDNILDDTDRKQIYDAMMGLASKDFGNITDFNERIGYYFIITPEIANTISDVNYSNSITILGSYNIDTESSTSGIIVFKKVAKVILTIENGILTTVSDFSLFPVRIGRHLGISSKTKATDYEPIDDYDPATKKYVDEHSGGSSVTYTFDESTRTLYINDNES